MPGTLRDDILAIPGIDDAQLEGDVSSPDGVRVRLSYGADPQRVGREVRRILALHGMRSQLTDVPDHIAPAQPPPPPPPAGTVVNLSDYESSTPAAAGQAAPPEETAPLAQPRSSAMEGGGAGISESVEEAVSPPPEPEMSEPEASEPEATEPEATEPEATEPETTEPLEPETPLDEPAEVETSEGERPEPDRSAVSLDAAAGVGTTPSGLAALGNVAVIEGVSGVTVTASTRLGKMKSRTAPVSAAGVDRAVVSAVSGLLVPDQDPPLLVEIIDSDHAGEVILTVVLELEAGEHAVGSAIQGANRWWALARATRAALSGAE